MQMGDIGRCQQIKACHMRDLSFGRKAGNHIGPEYHIRPAAAMPQLDPAIIKDRAGALRQLGIKQLDRFLDQSIGAPDELLVESGNRGHGRHFSKIRLDGDYVSAGQVVSVEIIGREGDWLIGRKQGEQAA